MSEGEKIKNTLRKIDNEFNSRRKGYSVLEIGKVISRLRGSKHLNALFLLDGYVYFAKIDSEFYTHCIDLYFNQCIGIFDCYFNENELLASIAEINHG